MLRWIVVFFLVGRIDEVEDVFSMNVKSRSEKDTDIEREIRGDIHTGMVLNLMFEC